MIRVLNSAGSTLVEWGRQQQQQQHDDDDDDDDADLWPEMRHSDTEIYISNCFLQVIATRVM